MFLQCTTQKFQTNESQQLNDLEIVKQSEVIRFELTNYILVLLKSTNYSFFGYWFSFCSRLYRTGYEPLSFFLVFSWVDVLTGIYLFIILQQQQQVLV